MLRFRRLQWLSHEIWLRRAAREDFTEALESRARSGGWLLLVLRWMRRWCVAVPYCLLLRRHLLLHLYLLLPFDICDLILSTFFNW